MKATLPRRDRGGYEENPGLRENAALKLERANAQNLLLRLDGQQPEVLRFAVSPRTSRCR